jgi:hypothetical protein
VLAKTRKLLAGIPAYLPGDAGKPSDEAHPEIALADRKRASPPPASWRTPAART